MVTIWKDIDSLKVFIGEDWKKPILTPDEVPLVDKISAEHFEYLEDK